MRNVVATLAIALGMLSPAASAADVAFELDANLFEKPAVVEKIFALLSYSSPLYEGLWPTREAFWRLDMPDRFTFCIAVNRS